MYVIEVKKINPAASIDWYEVIILAVLFCITYLYCLGFIKVSVQKRIW